MGLLEDWGSMSLLSRLGFHVSSSFPCFFQVRRLGFHVSAGKGEGGVECVTSDLS